MDRRRVEALQVCLGPGLKAAPGPWEGDLPARKSLAGGTMGGGGRHCVRFATGAKGKRLLGEGLLS